MTCKPFVVAALGVALTTAAVQAGSVTATFDDITSETFAAVPDGYLGLNWDNLYVIDIDHPPAAGSGYENGLISGDYTAFNGQGAPVSITAGGSDFIVDSGYLTAAWRTGMNVTIEGYRDGALVYADTVVVDSSEATFLEGVDERIDELVLTAFGGELTPGLPVLPTSIVTSQFALDNLSVSIMPVPPAALAGLAMLGGVGLVRLRTRR